MLFQQNWIYAILVACTMLGCKIPQLVPITTLVQLAITHGKVAKSVQRRAVCVTLHGLVMASQLSVAKKKP